jgi:8-amino-7-oxononanoate synthase
MTGIEKRLTSELTEISADGLMRTLRAPSGVDFSSNDYLSLARDSRVTEAARSALKGGTAGSTGSRLLRGERKLFADAEKSFADWKGTEASLYFATGYQANIGVLQTVLKKGDGVFSDSLNHASLIDGIRLGKAERHVYPHLDFKRLAELLKAFDGSGEKFVVTESLFSMDGDIAPLSELANVCRENEANLIVDEAHAVGLFGKSGSGLIEESGIADDVFLSVNTAGKALGVSGAFVAGSETSISYLINRCRSFIFSTAPMPACAAAILTSISIIRDEPAGRQKLQSICRRFEDLLAERNIGDGSTLTHIVPLIIGDSSDAVRIADQLQESGYDVRAIRPPTVPPGTARLRISLNTGHTEQVLISFVECLKEALKQ